MHNLTCKINIYFSLLLAIVFSSCSKKSNPTLPEKKAIVTTLAGNGTNGSNNGIGAAATFSDPEALCIDAFGNIYVGDGGDYLIRKVTPNGEVSTVAKIDTTAYTIGSPGVWGLTLDPLGTFYYTRTLGSVLYKVSPDGKPIVVAGSQLGDEDGPGGQAKFSNLIGLVSDIQGNIYGADYENYKIRKITPSGIVSTVPGTGVYTAPGISSTNFLSLQSIALDKNGNFYVTDPNQSAVIKLSSSGEAKHLASMRYPAGIVVDAVGNVYVSDMSDHIINKISTDGTITLIAGTGKRGYKDGMGAEAAFNTPQALVLDPTGKILYVADAANGAIRKIVLP